MKMEIKGIGIVWALVLGIAPLHGQTTLSITGFTPKTGVAGTVITVTGKGFNLYLPRRVGPSIEMLSDAESPVGASWVKSDGTQLKFPVSSRWSSNPPSPIKISLYVGGRGWLRATSTDSFTPIPLRITDFSPKTGGPGTEITVTGTAFDPGIYANVVHLQGTSGFEYGAANKEGTILKFRVPGAWSGAPAGPLVINFSTFSADAHPR
ncbi:MAG: IPT/TIG domain-containing protein, partial [Cytophagales bacterium]|nr:IPT/TIG domain-containing protein [Cytophagales bacterium]